MKDGAGTGKRALPIEDLLEWVYRVQRADLVLGRADNRERNWLAGAGISADGCAIVERQGVLGTRVDGGGYAAADLHPDAEAIHAQIGVLLARRALTPVQVGLLLECGKTGGVPEWRIEDGHKASGIKLQGGDGFMVSGGKFNRYCPISWEPPLTLALDLQDGYAIWYKALIIIYEVLSSGGGLIDYLPLFPAVSGTPWAD